MPQSTAAIAYASRAAVATLPSALPSSSLSLPLSLCSAPMGAGERDNLGHAWLRDLLVIDFASLLLYCGRGPQRLEKGSSVSTRSAHEHSVGQLHC
jgi:hypothetical protein